MNPVCNTGGDAGAPVRAPAGAGLGDWFGAAPAQVSTNVGKDGLQRCDHKAAYAADHVAALRQRVPHYRGQTPLKATPEAASEQRAEITGGFGVEGEQRLALSNLLNSRNCRGAAPFRAAAAKAEFTCVRWVDEQTQQHASEHWDGTRGTKRCRPPELAGVCTTAGVL